MKKILLINVLFFLLVFNFSGTYNKNSAYIVLESSSLRILEKNNCDLQFLIASTAKILTAITVIENYDLEEEIIISEEDTKVIGSKVYLKANEVIKRKDLLYALMLRSANDAAYALSDSDSDLFIKQMNDIAKKINMKNSYFVNSSGLDELEYNLSTAYDLAILAAYASQNNVFKEISSAHNYKCSTNVSEYNWNNKHKLVKSDNDFVWGKTGYTKKAGRILVSNYKKDNIDLIIVTINDADDWNHHRLLVDGLDDYYFMTIFQSGLYDTKLDISYYIYVENDIVLPIKKNEDDIVLEFIILDEIVFVNIYIENVLVLKKYLDFYTKENLDLDIIINILKST